MFSSTKILLILHQFRGQICINIYVYRYVTQTELGEDQVEANLRKVDYVECCIDERESLITGNHRVRV